MCILFRIEGTIDLGDPSFERLIFLVVEGVEICETRVKLRFGIHSFWMLMNSVSVNEYSWVV